MTTRELKDAAELRQAHPLPPAVAPTGCRALLMLALVCSSAFGADGAPVTPEELATIEATFQPHPAIDNLARMAFDAGHDILTELDRYVDAVKETL